MGACALVEADDSQIEQSLATGVDLFWHDSDVDQEHDTQILFATQQQDSVTISPPDKSAERNIPDGRHHHFPPYNHFFFDF